MKMMKVIQTANAIIPIDSILYVERNGNCINVYLKELTAPHNVIRVKFPTDADAKNGLNELYAKMVSE